MHTTPVKPHQNSTEETELDTNVSRDGLLLGAGDKKKKQLVMGGIFLAIVLAGGFWAYQVSQPKVPLSNQTAKPTVKIGLMLPFSGGSSASGFGGLKGVQLAKKQLGAENMEIVQIDSKCEPDAAAEAMRQLVEQNVVAVIGEACSSASLAALPIANSNKIPMISPSASSPELSMADDYFFRVVPADEAQGKFTAQLIYDKGQKNVAVLHSDEPYGNSLTKVFRAKYEGMGGKVVSVGSFPADDVYLTKQVAALKGAKPEAIYLISNSSPSAVAAIKLTREAGVTVPIYGADAINDKLILNEAKTAAEGLMVVGFSTGTKTFKQALASEYPSDELTFAAAEAYDAFKALHTAIESGATTGEQVKAALTSIDFEGASGRIKFDKNGEVTETEHQYDVLQAKDGSFVLVE